MDSPPYNMAAPGVSESTPRVDFLPGVNAPTTANLSDYDYSDRNGSHHLPVEQLDLDEQSQTVLIVLYSLTTALSVTGNILVILVFTFGRRSRSDLRGFLINLAIADLIMAIFCMPFTFTMTMLHNWIFSEPMCPIVLYMQTVSVTASVCTNMAIGIDRFWVVQYPLKSRITKSRSKFVIAVIWIISFAFSSVQLGVGRASRREVAPGVWTTDCSEIWPEPSHMWRRGYTFFLLTLTYLMPLFILALTYGFVGWKLWQRTTPGNADQARDSQQLKSKRKVIKMLVIVVVLFGICWLPLHVFILVLDFNPQLTMYESAEQERFFVAVFFSVHWLAMSNSFVNPIVYSFLNDSFRHDLKRLWRSWFPCCISCCPCLQAASLTRDTTVGGGQHYSRYAPSRRNSSGGSESGGGGGGGGGGPGGRLTQCPSKRLLSVKVNGYGKYDTELSTRRSLLRQDSFNNGTKSNSGVAV